MRVRPARPAGRGARRAAERGVFSADWLLVIAAVAGLGGLSAYLIEDYVETLTLERTAEQREAVTYLDTGRRLNRDHRAVRSAAATAQRIVEEAVSADPDDPRFETWADWARHYDTRCRRLKLTYGNLEDFAVVSLFLAPLKNPLPPISVEPTMAHEPLTAEALAAADTTPFVVADFTLRSLTPDGNHDRAGIATLDFLTRRKQILQHGAVVNGAPLAPGSDPVRSRIQRHAVAWCFLPPSISASLPNGTLDDENRNLLLRAAKQHALGVAVGAGQADAMNPGDPSLPGTWRNWESFWDAKCRRTVHVYRDLKGFDVRSTFRRPSGAPLDGLIYDPDRGTTSDERVPHKVSQSTATCEVVPA